MREQKWSSEPTRQETELAKKQAATTEGKLRAVVVEIKFDGQNGRRTQFFSSFDVANTQRLFACALPLAFGFAFANVERILGRKETSANVLKATRAIRDALLLPRVRTLPGVDAPFVLTCGQLYDYSGWLCGRCMKRHVGGLFASWVQKQRKG